MDVEADYEMDNSRDVKCTDADDNHESDGDDGMVDDDGESSKHVDDKHCWMTQSPAVA